MEMLALLSTGWNSGIYWGQQVWDVLPTWGSANLGEKKREKTASVFAPIFHFILVPSLCWQNIVFFSINMARDSAPHIRPAIHYTQKPAGRFFSFSFAETNIGDHTMYRALVEAVDLASWHNFAWQSPQNASRLHARTASFCMERSGYQVREQLLIACCHSVLLVAALKPEHFTKTGSGQT
jgi:hypothetical protein